VGARVSRSPTRAPGGGSPVRCGPGSLADLRQLPPRGGTIAAFQQVGQPQHVAVELALGIAGRAGRSDDLGGTGERVAGVLGAPEHVLAGAKRGGERAGIA